MLLEGDGGRCALPGLRNTQPPWTLTACSLQPDQAVEEVIEAQLALLVCVPENDQLQEGRAELEACGERGRMAALAEPHGCALRGTSQPRAAPRKGARVYLAPLAPMQYDRAPLSGDTGEPTVSLGEPEFAKVRVLALTSHHP